MPYSMRGLKYVTMNKGILSMPMMVIENDSVLEFRDCMVRSSRSHDGYGGVGDGKSDDRSEWTMKDRSNSFIDEKRDRDSLSGRRNSLSNGDLEDIAIWINGESLSDNKGVNQSFNGIGLFTSVIFHNFHVLTRCGINATLSL